MKPAPFDHVRAADAAEAVALLARHGGDAKILAGGQSLMPLLNFRMLRPTVLVDINKAADLAGIRADGDGLAIGALTRHHALETSPLVAARFPVLAEAMTHVAHLAIRNRGTIGGSLSHADPAAELPLMALLLDAEIRTRRPDGAGAHAARDFFLGPLTTALGEDELVVEIALPGLPPGTGWGFEEFSQRAGDFAFVAAAALLTRDGDRIGAARIGLMGVGDTPVRLWEIEARLAGATPSPDLFADAAAAARDAVEPPSDLRASADYRRRLVQALTARALTAAWTRATGATA